MRRTRPSVSQEVVARCVQFLNGRLGKVQLPSCRPDFEKDQVAVRFGKRLFSFVDLRLRLTIRSRKSVQIMV